MRWFPFGLKYFLVVWLAILATGLNAPLECVLNELISQSRQLDFPCADHECGCKTAHDCQTRCCCFPPKIIPVRQKSCCDTTPPTLVESMHRSLKLNSSPEREGPTLESTHCPGGAPDQYTSSVRLNLQMKASQAIELMYQPVAFSDDEAPPHENQMHSITPEPQEKVPIRSFV